MRGAALSGPRRLGGVGLAVCLLAAGGCSRAFVPHGPVPLAVEHASDDRTLYLQWLGVSSWVMSRGRDAVVLDPFFSRPSFGAMVLSLFHLTRDFGYKPERIADVLPALPGGTRFVLVGHAHYDHLLDVPYYLQRPSGRSVTYVGSRTAKVLLESFQPAAMDFQVPSGEPPAPIVRGPVTVRGFPSDHAPHIFGLLFMHVDGDLTEQTSLPTRAGEYVDGITQVHLVDFHDSTGKVAFRVFANGAASSKRGAEALARAKTLVRQHPTDVAILCVPGWDQVEEYPESVLGLLQHIGPDGRPRKGPRHVVLSHYDDFWAPYRNGEDPKVEGRMDFVIRANYAGFVDKLRKLKAEQGYTFEVHEPKTGQCLGFAGGGAPRPDQRRPLPCEP